MKKHNGVLFQLQDLEIQLKTATTNANRPPYEQNNDGSGGDEDALDIFMMKLSAPELDKKLVNRIKVSSI
jgi:hypothetical protein